MNLTSFIFLCLLCGLASADYYPAAGLNKTDKGDKDDKGSTDDPDKRPEVKHNVSLVLEKSEVILEDEAGKVQIWHPKDNPILRPDGLLVAFVSLETRALTFPAYFGSNLLLYVIQGNGKIGLVTRDGATDKDLGVGDVYALRNGAVAYLLNTNTTGVLFQAYILSHAPHAPWHAHQPYFVTGRFSRAGGAGPDGVLGAFDTSVLAQSFNAEGKDVDKTLHSQRKGPIVVLKEDHPLLKPSPPTLHSWFSNLFTGANADVADPYNIHSEGHDVDTTGGWSTVVNSDKASFLEKVDLGFFAVSLRPAAQVAPHWNALSMEIAIVTDGNGLVQIANANGTAVLDRSVKKGDIFVVPRFHPVIQQASRDENLQFIGFTLSAVPKDPKFLAGSDSVLKNIGARLLSAVFDAPEDSVDDFISAQDQAAIIAPNATASNIALPNGKSGGLDSTNY